MRPSLGVVLIGVPPVAKEFAITLASIRAEVDQEVPIVVLQHSEADHQALQSLLPKGLTVVDAPAALSLADILAFARPGDVWRPGALTARMHQLEAHPTAKLSVAGHELIDHVGTEVLTVRAPSLPLDPMELLLHASVEASAVLVYADALDAFGLELLARPHGAAVVWSRIAQQYGLLPSSEIAADVVLDPERHGFDPTARVDQLLAAAISLSPLNELGASSARRDLLRRLYIEPTAQVPQVDLTMLIGETRNENEEAAAVIADLQWALERQHDALEFERVRWPAHTDEHDKQEARTIDAELLDLQAKLHVLGSAIAVRDSKIRRLEAEVYRRDAIIENLMTRSPERD